MILFSVMHYHAEKDCCKLNGVCAERPEGQGNEIVKDPEHRIYQRPYAVSFAVLNADAHYKHKCRKQCNNIGNLTENQQICCCK